MSHANLTPLRGPSVWERPQLTSNTDRASLERALVGGAGLLLLALGSQGRSAGRRASILAGASLLALAGAPGGLDRARGWIDRYRWRLAHRDVVNEQSVESFPASDAPTWTATTGTGGQSEHGR
jgi:hypothetical protein